MNGDDFTITYILVVIIYSPEVHQLQYQAQNNIWIVEIDGEDTITDKGDIENIQKYQTNSGK